MRSDIGWMRFGAAIAVIVLHACTADVGVSSDPVVVSVGESCGGEVAGVGARRFDSQGDCVEPVVVLCVSGTSHEETTCALHRESGERYLTYYPISYREAPEWEPCSPELTHDVIAASPCE